MTVAELFYNLSQAVEEESESTKEVDTKEEIEENDLEVGRLEIEKQYFKLADGYRRNPFARLEVKKLAFLRSFFVLVYFFFIVHRLYCLIIDRTSMDMDCFHVLTLIR